MKIELKSNEKATKIALNKTIERAKNNTRTEKRKQTVNLKKLVSSFYSRNFFRLTPLLNEACAAIIQNKLWTGNENVDCCRMELKKRNKNTP